MKRSEMRLMERAIRQRWPVPYQMKVDAMETAHRMMNDPAVGERERLRAIQLALAAEAQNQKDEHQATDKEIQLWALAKQYGLEEEVAQVIEAGVGQPDRVGVDKGEDGDKPAKKRTRKGRRAKKKDEDVGGSS